MNYEDYHVHTSFSDDSSYEMEQVILDAIAKGITEICLSDHVDYGIKLDWDACTDLQLEKAATYDESSWKPGMERVVLNVNYPAYLAEIEGLQKKYQDKITIKTGLEFGIQTHTIADFEKLYEKYEDKWDFLLLSIHQVNNQEFWTGEFQQEKSQKEYNRAYYQELLDVIRQYKHYSVLAHLDLIARYDPAGPIAFEEVADLIEDILKTIIADGKGLEVNTSSLRYHMKDLHPSRKILQLYHKLGGTILTFGSDSHQPDHLGKAIQEHKELVKELGFTHYCTFEKMKPVFHPL